MAKRLKKVVPSETVAHLWAHRAQSEARNAQGNVYFEGDTIWSYGSHFPIARHVENKRGEHAILFTTRTHSITTAKHLSIVRRAIPPQVEVFGVSYPTDGLSAKMLDEFQSRLDEQVEQTEKSVKYKAGCLTSLDGCVQGFHRFAKFIGNRRAPKLPSAEWYSAQRYAIAKRAEREAWERANPSEAQQQREAASAKREAARERKAESDRVKATAQLEAWQRGESVSFPSAFKSLRCDYLRVFQGNVETSRHATVPLEHVQRVAPLVVRIINEGRVYKRNGHTIHLGNFALDAIDSYGNVLAGCHRFEKSEILRFAATLPPSETEAETEAEISEPSTEVA
jgi:hypothetical protein